MRALVLAVLASACTTANETSVGIAALTDATIRLGFSPPDTIGSGYADIQFAAPRLHGGCKSLNTSTATYDGKRESLDPGHEVPGQDSGTDCTNPGVTIAAFSPLLAADATYELAISDRTGTARMAVVGPYAPRAITIDEGMLIASAPVHLHWTPATDVVVPYAGGSAIGIICYRAPVSATDLSPLVFATTVVGGPNEVPLAAAGTDLTFTMPAVSYHGPVDCFVDAQATAALAACEGFAACNAPLLLPTTSGPQPVYVTPDALRFTTTM